MTATEQPSIPQYFAGKTIFVTGGSGFIGKVLLEKLLRSCHDLDRVYLLMRPKKGKTPEERIKKITDLPLFDRVKTERPGCLSKVHLVSGDVTQPALGLSPEDRAVLVERVQIVFHGAASVRFDDPVDVALLMNTRGTREVMQLALDMEKLEALVHISTTYCHTDRKVIGEELYPPHKDWRQAIEMAERCEQDWTERAIVRENEKEYIKPCPNTYTFAKGLAEHVIYDMGNGKIPLAIFRPSIVISTVREPIKGWMDNFNGPVGLLVASGKGLIRSVYADPNIIADYVPVDLVVKALIITAWKKANEQDRKSKLETSFYNASNNGYRPVTTGAIVEMGRVIMKDYPLENIIWHPDGSITKCIYNYYVRVALFQFLPAFFIDILLRLTGHKPILWNIQKKIFTANIALRYFLTNQWQFINTNSMDLENHLQPSDMEAFSYYKDEVTEMEYFTNATIGAKKYLLKEGDTFEKARRHATMMRYLHYLVLTLWYTAVLWLIFCKFDLLGYVFGK